MGKYNFDQVIDRRGTGAIKTDALQEMFGRNDLRALWIADMDFAVAPAIADAIARRAAHPIYGYPSVPDSYWQSIINWLDRRHNWKVSKEDMIYVPGIVRGIGYVINYFTRPGDAILIQPPVYHPFRHLTEGNERRVVTNPLILEGDTYRMDFEGLEKAMAQEKPRLMILCNPHNPAGIQWSEEDLRRVAALARKYGVLVVSDEIHGDLMLKGCHHTPFLATGPDAEAVGIAFGAPSKTFNIAGLVSSWCVIKNPELRKGFFNWMTVNEFCVPTFMAMVGTEAAYNNGEEWLDEMLNYVEGTIEAVVELAGEILPEVKIIRPQASFLLWLDCRSMGLNHDRLVDLFVNKAHLALNDGVMFGAEGDGFMRLNIGEPRQQVLQAIRDLADALHC